MMSKRWATGLFVRVRKLKAQFVEERKHNPDVELIDLTIKDIDEFLALEEKVKKMKRANVTSKIERKMLEIMEDIGRRKDLIETLIGRRELNAKFLAFAKDCGMDIETECSG